MIMSNSDINEINFRKYFNQEIDHYIPDNIKIIRFNGCSEFNKNINFLPETIEVIEFGCYKDHTLEELRNLPASLKELKLGGNFNQKITKNVLPKNLTYLAFGDKFNQEIDHNIPDNIKIIKFNHYSKFNKNVKFLPKSIEAIYYGLYKNHTLEELKNFPRSLKKLKLGGLFNQEIIENVLPKNLTYLFFDAIFNQKIKQNILPCNLTHLSFGGNFNQKITENVLPYSLTHLSFGEDFNQEITENVLPLNLTHLKFGGRFNQKITGNTLPPNLTHLTFGWDFNQEIKKNIFTLFNFFGLNFNQEITDAVLPKSLKVLKLPKNNKDKILKNIDLLKITFDIIEF